MAPVTVKPPHAQFAIGIIAAHAIGAAPSHGCLACVAPRDWQANFVANYCHSVAQPQPPPKEVSPNCDLVAASDDPVEMSTARFVLRAPADKRALSTCVCSPLVVVVAVTVRLHRLRLVAAAFRADYRRSVCRWARRVALTAAVAGAVRESIKSFFFVASTQAPLAAAALRHSHTPTNK